MFGLAAALACALAAAGRSTAAPALGLLAIVPYPSSVRDRPPVARHSDDVEFLQAVMLKDRLWKPILSHRVKMTAEPRRPTDHFASAPAAAAAASVVVVDPFREAALLMAANSLAGTEVKLAVAAVRAAMACSALRHLSAQALLLHHLIDRGPETARAAGTVTRWLEQMVRVAVDKLAAVEQRAPLVARLHFHVRQLMLPHADPAVNELRDIGTRMHDEMCARCVVPDGRPYAWLVRAYKSPATAERFDPLNEAVSADENAKGVVDLHSIRELQQLSGSLNVPEDVDAAGLGNASEDDLKKLLTVNRIEMNFLWANLPIRSLADTQWSYLFNLKALYAH